MEIIAQYYPGDVSDLYLLQSALNENGIWYESVLTEDEIPVWEVFVRKDEIERALVVTEAVEKISSDRRETVRCPNCGSINLKDEDQVEVRTHFSGPVPVFRCSDCDTKYFNSKASNK